MYKRIVALLVICFAFIINALECESNDRVMEIEFQNSVAYGNVTITKGAVTVLQASVQAGQGRQFFEACLGFGFTYTFNLYRAYSDGLGNSCEGGSGSVIHLHDEWIIIRYHNTEVHRRALPRSTDNSDYVKCSLNSDQRTLTLTEPEYFIPPYSNDWLYSDEIQYSLEWTRTDSALVSFTTFHYGAFYTQNIRYYRHSFTLDNLEQNFILYIDLDCPYGVILYINSIEAFRSNLREIDYIRHSSRSYDNSTVDHWRTIILKTNEYVQSTTTVTLAIEVHLAPEIADAEPPVYPKDIFHCGVRKVSVPTESSIINSVPATVTRLNDDESETESYIMDRNYDTSDYNYLSNNVRYRIDFPEGSGIWFNQMTFNVHFTCEGCSFGDKRVQLFGHQMRDLSNYMIFTGILRPISSSIQIDGTNQTFDGNITVTTTEPNFFTYTYYTMIIPGNSTGYHLTINEIFFELLNREIPFSDGTPRIQYYTYYHNIDRPNYIISQRSSYADLVLFPYSPDPSTFIFNSTSGQFNISYTEPGYQVFKVCSQRSEIKTKDCAHLSINILLCPSTIINGYPLDISYPGTTFYYDCDTYQRIPEPADKDTARYSSITCHYIRDNVVAYDDYFTDYCDYNFPVNPYGNSSFVFYVNETAVIHFNATHQVTSFALNDTRALSIDQTTGDITVYSESIIIPARRYEVTVFVGPLSYTYYIDIKVIARNCPVDGEWPLTETYETANIPCPTGFNGNRTRDCLEDGSWSSINTNSCSIISPPYPYAESSYVFTVGDTVSIPVIDILNYPATSFSASSLPEGLSINPTSGTISGTCSAYTPETTYTITVSNNRYLNGQFHSITVDHFITITVLSAYCNEEQYDGDTWIQTPVNTNRTIECPSDHYNGYKTRLCKIGGSWDAIYDACVPKDPIYPYSTYYFILRIETDHTILPIENAYFTQISIEPGLPEGFSMDTTTGIISGNVATVMEKTEYTLTVVNIDKSNQYTMYIEFVNGCLADDIWPETPIGTTVARSCVLTYVGVRRRTCLADGSWSDVEEECIPENVRCIGDFFYNSTSGFCESCADGYTVYSKACDSNMKCIHCETNQIQINGQCVSSPPTCSSIDGWPATPASHTAILDCGTNSYGTKTRKCVYNNGVAEWGDIDDTLCRTLDITSGYMQFDFDIDLALSARHYSHDLLLPLAHSTLRTYNYHIGRLYLKYEPVDETNWDSDLSSAVRFISNLIRGHRIERDTNLTNILYASFQTNLRSNFSNYITESNNITLNTHGVPKIVSAACTNPISNEAQFDVLYESLTRCNKKSNKFLKYFCTQYIFEPVPLPINYVFCGSSYNGLATEKHIGFVVEFSGADAKYLYCYDEVIIYRGILASFREYGVRSLKITSLIYNTSNDTTYVDAYIVPFDSSSISNEAYENIIKGDQISSRITAMLRNDRFTYPSSQGSIQLNYDS